MRYLERLAIYRLASVPGSSGISALHDEVLDEPVENGVVVVAFEAQLDEVAACYRALFAPQLDVDVTECRFQADLNVGWI